MGIVEYTNYPFEYSDGQGNKNVWVPDDTITLSMAGICALGIPLLIYLYAVGIRRAKRAENLLVKRSQPVEETPEKDVSDEKTAEKPRKRPVSRKPQTGTDPGTATDPGTKNMRDPAGGESHE